MRLRLATLGITVPAVIALGAIAAWPFFVTRSVDEAQASALPTMAPVVADYNRRDWEIHQWERAVALHHRGDMLTPARLASEYLQRYRERGDIDDVLRAEHAAKASVKAEVHYIPGIMTLSAAYLTLHRFYAALDTIDLALTPAIRQSRSRKPVSIWKSAATRKPNACSTKYLRARPKTSRLKPFGPGISK